MKKNMKKILGVTLAACMAATSLAGCSGSPGKQTTAAPAAGEPGAGQAAQSTATGEPIKVGVSNMVTGPMAAGGIRMKQAITMAFEEINANGGVLGGITSGMPLLVRAAIKPTPSIAAEQRTLNLRTGKVEPLSIHGRHDPCIVTRAAPVIEAACAVALADLLREAKGYA